MIRRVTVFGPRLIPSGEEPQRKRVCRYLYRQTELGLIPAYGTKPLGAFFIKKLPPHIVRLHGKLRVSRYASGLTTTSIYLECTADSNPRVDSSDPYEFIHTDHRYISFPKVDPNASYITWRSLYAEEDIIGLVAGRPLSNEYIITSNSDLSDSVNLEYGVKPDPRYRRHPIKGVDHVANVFPPGHPAYDEFRREIFNVQKLFMNSMYRDGVYYPEGREQFQRNYSLYIRRSRIMMMDVPDSFPHIQSPD
jgi:hypothetical protein